MEFAFISEFSGSPGYTPLATPCGSTRQPLVAFSQSPSFTNTYSRYPGENCSGSCRAAAFIDADYLPGKENNESPSYSDYYLPNYCGLNPYVSYSHNYTFSFTKRLEELSSKLFGKHEPQDLLDDLDMLKYLENYYNFQKGQILILTKEFEGNTVVLSERDSAVEILKNIHEVFLQLPHDIFSVAVNIFDRYFISNRLPFRSAKLIIAICYQLAAEDYKLNQNFDIEVPTHVELLNIIGASKNYSADDYIFWKSQITLYLENEFAGFNQKLPLAISTRDFLKLFAIGYGLTNRMSYLLNVCLTKISLIDQFSPCVLAMSVFYASIPKSKWDVWEYPEWFASRCGINGNDFANCIQYVMGLARNLDIPDSIKICNSLKRWREKFEVSDNNSRVLQVSCKEPFMPVITEE